MIYLFFIGGIVVGSIITQIIINFRTGYGHFDVVPVNDPDIEDMYNVRISLTKDQQLQKKKKIILKRVDTLK